MAESLGDMHARHTESLVALILDHSLRVGRSWRNIPITLKMPTGRQARALLAITAPSQAVGLSQPTGHPLLVHKIGLTECCFQTPFFPRHNYEIHN